MEGVVGSPGKREERRFNLLDSDIPYARRRVCFSRVSLASVIYEADLDWVVFRAISCS